MVKVPVAAIVCSVFAALANADAGSYVISLSGVWRFSRDGKPSVDVTVPHDWAIAGPFDPEQEGGTGKLPWKGTGEYRKTFVLKQKPSSARLEFDGVMAWPEVFVNGIRVGGWDYGYLGFVCDITTAVAAGTNEIAVTATTLPHKSRWYPGGGIYRDVRLVTGPADHLVPNSVFIRTSRLTKEEAVVAIDWEMSVGGRKSRSLAIQNPRLWDVDDPYLYETEVAGERFRFGIREAVFTADDGFHLNGRRVQLKGVNLHADLGILGMAFDRDAAKRQLLLMKDMGANAIRTAHNPAAPQFLDLCDEMGFLVWNECFDKWDETAGRKPEQPLESYVTRNLEAFVRRDRNHPSVICWSIGNEISPVGGRYGDASGMTPARTRLFRDAVRAQDPTRPVTAGCADEDLYETGAPDGLDLCGWNYERTYAPYRKTHPKMPMLYSESASAVSNGGYYRFAGSRHKADFPLDDMQADGYDLTSAWCGDIADIEFYRVEKDRFLAGEFVWTGIDYLGEPCPFCYIGVPDCWPNATKPERERPRSSYFGIADLVCLPKDRWYLYRSHWNKRAETVHIVPGHWNVPASRKQVPIFVYTSGDSAELFLNGRSLGRRQKDLSVDVSLDFAGRNPPPDDYEKNAYYRVCARYRLRWADVPNEPGELKAVAFRDGKKVGETVLRTAGRPVAIRLTADPYTPEGSRLAFVRIELVDDEGVCVPDDDRMVSLSFSGDGKLLAVGNGNPIDFDSFAKTTRHRLYNGKAVVFVRRGTVPGLLTASAIGVRAEHFNVYP